MQRNVFEKIPMDGFRTSKVETIAICNFGQRLFVGKKFHLEIFKEILILLL